MQWTHSHKRNTYSYTSKDQIRRKGQLPGALTTLSHHHTSHFFTASSSSPSSSSPSFISTCQPSLSWPSRHRNTYNGDVRGTKQTPHPAPLLYHVASISSQMSSRSHDTSLIPSLFWPIQKIWKP